MFLENRVTLRDVTSNRPSTERLRALGAAVEAARGHRGLTIEEAATAGGIWPVPWRNVELGVTKAQTKTYTAIERVLRWPQGQCARILAGEVALGDDPDIAYVTEGLAQMTPEQRLTFVDLVRAIVDPGPPGRNSEK